MGNWYEEWKAAGKPRTVSASYWITDGKGNRVREITETEFRILAAGGRLPEWKQSKRKEESE